MAHEVETMAYAGELPWHGLGRKVNPDLSIDEMIKEAGLDWTVESRPMYYKRADGTMAVVRGRKALVRSSDERELTITGSNWHPVQNYEALGFFRRYAGAGLATLETAGSLMGGKRVWGLANLHHDFTVGKTGDKVKGYILFTTAHQVGVATKVRLTTVRVVCANTLALALNGSDGVEYSQNHLSQFDFEKAHETIDLMHEKIGKFEKTANQLKKTKLSLDDSIKFLAPFFHFTDANTDLNVFTLPANRNKPFEEVITSMVKAPGADEGTAWGVLNGVTHWADHVAGRSTSNRLQRSWFGDNAKLKADVAGWIGEDGCLVSSIRLPGLVIREVDLEIAADFSRLFGVENNCFFYRKIRQDVFVGTAIR